MVDDAEAELNNEERAACERAAEGNRELLRMIGQRPDSPVGPMSVRQNGEALVLVTVPRQFFYRPNHHKMVVFTPGVQEIPQSLADAKWVRDNGVQRVDLADAAINEAMARAPAPQPAYALGEPSIGTGPVPMNRKPSTGKKGAN